MYVCNMYTYTRTHTNINKYIYNICICIQKYLHKMISHWFIHKLQFFLRKIKNTNIIELL